MSPALSQMKLNQRPEGVGHVGSPEQRHIWARVMCILGGRMVWGGRGALRSRSRTLSSWSWCLLVIRCTWGHSWGGCPATCPVPGALTVTLSVTQWGVAAGLSDGAVLRDAAALEPGWPTEATGHAQLWLQPHPRGAPPHGALPPSVLGWRPSLLGQQVHVPWPLP